MKCGRELDRHSGEWVRKHNDRDVSGYWISLLMCPWVSAQYVLDKQQSMSEEQFANFVLGQPYIGRGNVLTREMFVQNLTSDVNPMDARVVIGVDTGVAINYVCANRYGTFFYDKCSDYAPIRNLLLRWPNAVAVIDQGGDIIGPRKLREEFPNRVFLCFFRADRKNDELVTWNDEDGTVTCDRNRMIQLVVDEFAEKRMPVYGTEAEWHDYLSEWLGMYRTVEECVLQTPVHRWNKPSSGRCDYPFCFSGDTLVSTSTGDVPICHVKVGDMVLTRKGYRKVLWSGLTRKNAGVYEFKTKSTSVIATRDHRMYTKEKGFDKVDVGDTIYVCKRNTQQLTASGSPDTQNPARETTGSTFKDSLTGSANRFIATCTLRAWDTYQMALSSTTRTAIQPTIVLRTLTLMERGQHQSMHATELWATADPAKRARMQPEGYSEKKFAWHRSAEGRRAMSERAKNQYRGTITCQLCGTVAEVKRKVRSTVLPGAGGLSHQETGEPPTLVTERVTSVSTALDRDVYDIEVEGEHEFFANGILVHNCQVYARVGLSRFIESRASLIPARLVVRLHGSRCFRGRQAGVPAVSCDHKSGTVVFP